MNSAGGGVPRVLWAATLAGICAVFVATAAYVDFAALRVRAVREPIAAGRDGVRVPLEPSRLNGLGAPFAVVAGLRNDSPSAASFAIRIDEREVCSKTVPGGGSARADCQFAGPWDPSVSHQVAIASDAESWSVEALEVSTHHGSNAAIVRLFILPASSRHYQTPGWIACAALWILLTALMLVPPPPLPLALRVVRRFLIAGFALWAVAVAVSPFVSSYRVIVSRNTVVAWLMACLAPQIYRVVKPAGAAAAGWLRAPGPVPKSLVAASLVVICFAVVVERRVAVEFDGNRSGLLLLSRERIDPNPWLQTRDDVKQNLVLLDNRGYDAQFMYAIAFDPFLRRFHDQPEAYQPFIDTPPYRYGRVGYPLLARTLALNQPERFPLAMIALIYAGVFSAAFGAGWLAWRSGASAWWGLSILLVPGFWMSFRTGLPEPLAAGAAVLGLLLARERRYVAAALLLAAACLVRETAVFVVVCLSGWLAMSKQPREAVKVLVIALGPLCLWRLYVGSVFAPVWGLEAYWNPPADFGWPLGGIAGLWSDLSAGRYYPDLWEMRRSVACFSILVMTGSVLSWRMLRVSPGPVTAAAALFGAMAINFNLSAVWVETRNAERLACDLFLFLALASPEFVSKSRAWRMPLAGFWLAVAVYLLFGTLDASFTRESFAALVPWA